MQIISEAQLRVLLEEKNSDVCLLAGEEEYDVSPDLVFYVGGQEGGFWERKGFTLCFGGKSRKYSTYEKLLFSACSHEGLRFDCTQEEYC